MKYKKSIKNIKKKLLTGFAIAITALFASVPAVDAFAADTVSSESSELEALRIKKEAAQAAYDAALADKLMAEDEVENARIALKDAQDNYEDVRERYATGFAGFLQWVIETEDDPVKTEDARRVLEEAFAGEQQISADDPANITRMFYIAYWLEELAEFFRSRYGVEADTSHAAMRLAQSGFFEYHSDGYGTSSADDIQKAYDKMTFDNERISATINEGICKGFWCVATDLAATQQAGVPILEGLSKRVEDPCDYSFNSWARVRTYDSGDKEYDVLEDGEYFYSGPPGKEEYDLYGEELHIQRKESDILTRYREGTVEYFYQYVNEDYMAELLKNPNTFFRWENIGVRGEDVRNCLTNSGYSILFEDNLLDVINLSKGITIGNALDVDSAGLNYSSGVVYNGKGTYTIDEYVRALREYCSMIDPVEAKAYLAFKKDDLENARRQLAGAEGLLATAYGTLKGAEKEYEEAAAGFTGLIEVPVNEGVASEAEELIAGEATSYANEVSVSQQTAFAGDHYSESETALGSVLPEAHHITEQSPVGAEAQELQAAQATAKTDGQEVTVFREETLQNSLSSEAQELQAAQATAKEEGQEAILSREDTFAERVSTSGGAASETPATEAADYSESAAIDAPEKEAGLQSSSEKDKQKNGVLAEVLSYIFNGGAIAFIIPAGFRRKKKTGEMLQGEC